MTTTCEGLAGETFTPLVVRADAVTAGGLPEQLDAGAKAIEAMRNHFLGDPDVLAGETCPPQAEQHLLLAIAALETAQRHMQLACYLARRGD